MSTYGMPPWNKPGAPPGGVPGLFGFPRPNERPFGPVEGPEMVAPPGGPVAPPVAPPTPAPPSAGADLASLVRRIEGYLQDEVTANRFYQELAAQCRNETIKRYLLEAARDEQKHFQLLSQLYQRITGRPAPRPQPQEQSFPTLRDALLKAIDNEFEAYEDYKNEYQRFADPQIRWIFFELFSDEIEHAVRFNTALHIMAGMA